MSDARRILESIIIEYSVEKFRRFFRKKSQQFTPKQETYSRYDDDDFINGLKIGEINFSKIDYLLICAFKVTKALSERTGKKAQYDKAKSILKSTENQKYSAGIFIFYDVNGNFRFSLVYPESIGTKRQWNNFRRFTYFVSREFTNKTFLKQIGDKEFLKLDDVKSAFSITAVTDLFYNEFFKIYDRIVQETKKVNNIISEEKARDFVLLFTIRTIFLGFIQKKKWLGDNEKFIQDFYQEYKDKLVGKNEFYSRWLSPLFFEALNSPQGGKIAYGNNDFSKETEGKLQMAPFLNGGLFRPKSGYDTNGWMLSDQTIEDFFEFLFSHSFTVEENSLEDEDLQLNPEFLGIIFERLVNKADGAVYTPRPEVDLMCRFSLVKWLQKNLEDSVRVENLYELFFKESEKEEEQKQGSFSQKEAQKILNKLENLSICDPAVGSGAFLVGMMQVLDGVEQSLRTRYGLNGVSLFERKKQIIKNSLYGVEVKEWAVWICQLRLWLSLFVDAPDDLKNSFDAILPSLDFKVRQGDSLVQRVGSKAFPVSGHNIALSKSVKDKITKLKNLKLQYFDNKSSLLEHDLKRKELEIYEEILHTEVNEKLTELKHVRDEKPVSALSLFEKEKEQPAQAKLSFNQKIIQKLEDQITKLKEKQQQLRNGNKPLVWSIEFADVFSEKGGFDIVIGNPPYVRQEDIADPTGRIKNKKEYKDYLQEMVKLDFPDYFPPKAKINAQSDLYTYFYVRALRLLNSQGIHTFICSNSWLDVGYGVWLQEFLLNSCPIDLIIDNQAKRSFQAADVNTIISVVHAPQKKVDKEHIVKFVAFKQPFESAIFTENLIDIENAEKITSKDIFRVYPISNNELQEAGTEYDNETQTTMKIGKYVGDKWGGKYLRAPDIYWKVVSQHADKLTPFSKALTIKRGITTGAVSFFYLDDDVISKFKIESRYVKPVVNSSRQLEKVFIEKANKLFFCSDSKEILKGSGALNYIKWGEKNNVDKITTVKSNSPYWYSLKGENVDFIIFRFWDRRFWTPVTSIDTFCSDNFFYGKFKGNTEIGKTQLNSTWFFFQIEIMGRVNQAEGVLTTYGPDYKYIRFVRDNLLKQDKSTNLLNKLSRRKVLSVFEELGINPRKIRGQRPNPLPDRKALDDVIFDALGLSQDERNEVYWSLCELVKNRLEKAKSV